MFVFVAAPSRRRLTVATAAISPAAQEAFQRSYDALSPAEQVDVIFAIASAQAQQVRA
jgi:hypothetical protein